MSDAASYSVEAQYEPHGPGTGWTAAPSDAVATTFCVIEEYGAERSVIDAKPTRAAAQSVVRKLTSARRMKEEYRDDPIRDDMMSYSGRKSSDPTSDDPIGDAIRSWPQTIMWGIPAVLLFWLIAASLK